MSNNLRATDYLETEGQHLSGQLTSGDGWP